MLFIIGISKITNKFKYSQRLLIILVVMFGTIGLLIFTDYINVKRNNVAPMFRETTLYLGGEDSDLLYYDGPFYDVIKCDDRYNIVKNKKYTHEELFDYCNKNK